jgi:H+/gluconate symporter-like permease
LAVRGESPNVWILVAMLAIVTSSATGSAGTISTATIAVIPFLRTPPLRRVLSMYFSILSLVAGSMLMIFFMFD